MNPFESSTAQDQRAPQKPGGEAFLSIFGSDIARLLRDGYDTDMVARIFKEHGYGVSGQDIRDFAARHKIPVVSARKTA